MAIEGVKWGSTGPFAFNVWVKQASNKGSMFQYVISTRARDLGNVTDDNIFYPNQVCSCLAHLAGSAGLTHQIKLLPFFMITSIY